MFPMNVKVKEVRSLSEKTAKVVVERAPRKSE